MHSAARQQLRDVIDGHATFFHVTHVNPDADGLGSALAMSRWLRSLGKSSHVLLSSPVPSKSAFLVQPDDVRVVNVATESLPADAVYMIYDVSTPRRLGPLEAVVRRSASPAVVFDHHDGDSEFECIRIVDVEAGATGQVVFDLLDAWQVPVTLDLAIPLYVAIVADTGSFNYGKTSPHTHHVAARLLETGLDPLAIHGQLEGNKSLPAMRVGGEVLRTLTIDAAEPRLAHATMTRAQYEDGGADALDMLDLVNTTIALRGVQAGVLFIEADATTTRLSLRSKGGTSVVETARHFGGGGHVNAAGATVNRPLAAVREEVLDRLRGELARQLGTAGG